MYKGGCAKITQLIVHIISIECREHILTSPRNIPAKGLISEINPIYLHIRDGTLR